MSIEQTDHLCFTVNYKMRNADIHK